MHLVARAIVAASLLTLGVDASPVRSVKPRNVVHKGVSSHTWKPQPFAAASPNVATSHYLEMRKTGNKRNPRSAGAVSGKNAAGDSTTLQSLELGEEFATSIKFGSQTLEVIVDTGSSDTWAVLSGFECLAFGTTTQVPESQCNFGPTYSLDSTFTPISGEFFNITYGDGETLGGYFGTEQVTLAGLTVNQQIAVANATAWLGDGVTSGLTGFAYPALTSAYSDSTGQQITYDPLFTTMYKEGVIPPLFSLAILRDTSGPSGYLALGGTPPVNYVQEYTSTPILITSIQYYPKTYDFYTINIDGVTINGRSYADAGGSDIQYIVDSGTTLNYYPTRIANAVNAAFNPPAVYNANDGAYIVDCNATAPVHGITINGNTFYINPLDMILFAGTDANGNDVCISGIDDGGSDTAADVYVLGDTFQKNVVTVFDVGAGELRFAPHENYSSNDQY